MSTMLYAIVLTTIAFYHATNGQLPVPVDCSDGKYQAHIFLSSQGSIYVCDGSSLSQRGCFIPGVGNQNCVDFNAVMNSAEADVKAKLQTHANPATGYDCANILVDYSLLFNFFTKGFVQDCGPYLNGDGKKYKDFTGHALCNINGKQVYKFEDYGWHKCNESGIFELQSCVGFRGDSKPQCGSKADLDKEIEEIPSGYEIYESKEKFCVSLRTRTEFLNETLSACTFDDPIKIEKTTPTTTPNTTIPTTSTSTTTTTTKANPTTTATVKPPPPTDAPKTQSTTKKSDPLTTSTPKKPTNAPSAPSTSTAKPTTTTKKPEPPPTTTTTAATTKPVETTTAEEGCENGVRYNVWYDNQKPTHCYLVDENRDGFYADIKMIYDIFREGRPQYKDWVFPKQDILYWKLKYMGRHHREFNAMNWVHDWYLLKTNIDELLRQFANEELEMLDGLPIGPRSFCNFVANFLPLTMNFIKSEIADNRVVNDDCEPRDDIEAITYPVAKYNVWWESQVEGLSPTSCYVNYLIGPKKCITFKRAENILSQITSTADANDQEKLYTTAVLLSLSKGYPNRWQTVKKDFYFSHVIGSRVHIRNLVTEYNAMLTKNVNQDHEDTYPFMIDSSEPLKLGVSNFCTIFSDLVPLTFDHKFVDFYFHDCYETVEERDFPDSRYAEESADNSPETDDYSLGD